jgi:hypothetical protein
MYEMPAITAEYDTDDEIWYPSVDSTRYMPSLQGSEVCHGLQGMMGLLPLHESQTATKLTIPQAPEERPLQFPLEPASGPSVPTHLHEPEVRHGFQVAEALNEVDAYDPRTVVRVNGLRAFGDEGLSIVARYLNQHVGSVRREVPVVTHKASGQHKPGNFGFIVMSCAAEAEQILAHDTLIVNCHKIRVRAFAAKPRECHAAETHADPQRSAEGDQERLEESSDWLHRRIVL